MNVEKLLSVAERQKEQFDCIAACVVTGLKYFNINVFTLSSLKAVVSKQFGWPHGSTFGNYQRIIIEANKVDIKMHWPVINLNEGTKYTKNQQLLERAKELITNDNVVLCMVQVDFNNAHCHILLNVSDKVDYWDPATGNSDTRSLSEYLNLMNTDMLAIGKK